MSIPKDWPANANAQFDWLENTVYVASNTKRRYAAGKPNLTEGDIVKALVHELVHLDEANKIKSWEEFAEKKNRSLGDKFTHKQWKEHLDEINPIKSEEQAIKNYEEFLSKRIIGNERDAIKNILSNDEGSWTIRDRTIRDKHDRYRAIAAMTETSGGSSPTPVLENYKNLFTLEEYNRLFEYFQNKGAQDVFSGKARVETVAKDAKISDLVNYNKKEVGIPNNERGAIRNPFYRESSPIDRLTVEQLASIDKIFTKAKELGVAPEELMKRGGASPELIAAASKIYNDHIQPLRTKGLEPILKGPYKEYDPKEVIRQGKSRNYKGYTITKPPVLRSKVEAIANMEDIKGTTFESWRPPIHTFNELPLELKDWYTRERNARSTSDKEFSSLRERLKEVTKGLSKRDRRDMYLYSQTIQEGGSQMLKAMGLKEVRTLTPKQKKAYDFMRDEYGRAFIENNEVRTATGRNPLKEEPNYFTRARSFSLAERLGLKYNHLLMDELDIMNNDAMHGSAAFPYSKKRSKINTQALDLDAVAVFEKYMKAHTEYKHITPIVAEISETIKPFKAQAEMSGATIAFNPRYNRPNFVKFISEWADSVGNTSKEPLSKPVNTALSILNKNAAYATLSNVGTAALQFSSLVPVGALVGPKHLGIAAAKMLDPREIKTALKQSDTLFSRQADLSVAGDAGLGKIHSTIGDASLWLMKETDFITATTTFIAARDFAVNKGLSMKRAINWADDIVVKTQGSTMKGDVAPIQRTALGKTATLFQTFTIANWNTLLRDIAQVIGPKTEREMTGGRFKTVGRFIIGSILANYLYKSTGFRSAWPEPWTPLIEGIDEGEDAHKIAWNVIKEFSEYSPLIGNVKFGSSFLSKPIVTLHNLMTGGPYRTTVGHEIEMLGEGEFPPFLGEAAGTLAGIPLTGQLRKSYNALNRGEEGFDIITGKNTQRQ